MPIDEPHELSLHVVVVEELPPHDQRTESELFKKNRKLLVEDHGLDCWSCGSKDDLQCHHMIEWATFNWIDTEKMVKKLAGIDIYGFSKMYNGKPIESPDDIRNLIMLCQKCHTGKGTGKHFIPDPIWLAQACVQDGHTFVNPALHDELKRRSRT